MSLLTHAEMTAYLEALDNPKTDGATRAKIGLLLEMDKVEKSRESFLYFVTQMWPIFISGSHHKIMADAFERVAKGEL